MVTRRRTGPGYLIGTVEKVTGVDKMTLNFWARTNFVPPSIQDSAGKGTFRRWSFEDIVAIRTAKHLRDQGLSLQKLRRVADFLGDITSMRQPLASAWLIVQGEDVFLTDGQGVVSLLEQPGQMAVPAVVLNLESVRGDVERRLKAA